MISNFKCNRVLMVNVHTRFLISVLKISTSVDGLRSINYSAFNYVSITTAAERGWIKHEAWFPRNNTFLLWRRWLVCISYVVIRIFACFHVSNRATLAFFFSLHPFSFLRFPPRRPTTCLRTRLTWKRNETFSLAPSTNFHFNFTLIRRILQTLYYN